MAPSDYIQSRELATQNNGQFFTTLVDGRPYLPNLAVEASNPASVCNAAVVSVTLSTYIAATNDASDELKTIPLSIDWESLLKESSASLTCTKVTGGITNALFRVSGFEKLKPAFASVVTTLLNNSTSINCSSLIDFNSVLIRIFGAEGMINRDIETSTYAALCNADIAYRYLGRFNNGRVEGWLDGFLPLQFRDLSHDETSLGIAKEMARLHCLFEVPDGELRDHHFGTELDVITVGLWDQLSSWMEKAKGYSEFKTPYDTERVKKLELDRIELEVQNFITSFASTSSENGDSGDSTASVCSAKVVFCHNDLLAGNIMRHPETSEIQLIDFEYGGTNYAAFDIANHFNEHAGGTDVEENGVTDYTLFPNPDQQKNFCVEYVRTAKRLESMKSGLTEPGDVNENGDLHSEASDLLNQVQKFILINHLYWGLWAINQAAEEGCEEFDYITYATNRFKEFHAKKVEWEKDDHHGIYDSVSWIAVKKSNDDV
eukprot:CAMPEP_0172316416 /NCGR_PEP_ID=MMETSP1058-20130122/28114_1 /TAXON_ID=83371 /ORGANISM="Detonula confervacea, Strain CCMP 353" /LENGTH=488 /DNA_ID=CAMNT_0013030717 /DNA_START=14 /DNA_END=1477 /DNA_ORIENTATION=-